MGSRRLFAVFILLPLVNSNPLNFTSQVYHLVGPAPPAINCVQYNGETQELENVVCESFSKGAYWLIPVCAVFYEGGRPAKESMRCWGVDHDHTAQCAEACPSISGITEKKFWRCCCFRNYCNQ